MQSRPHGTIAGARADGAALALPPPRRISHTWNLLWWVVLLALAGGGYYAETLIAPPREKAELPSGNEREAFLVVTFGKIGEKVGEQGPDVIPATTFRDQLRALRGAGYTSIGLDSLEAFYGQRHPLPDRPVLLLFDNVQRDSIEIADQGLAETNFRGVAFADVAALADANIDLVSRHRLRQLAETDRWDIGIADCPRADTPQASDSPAVTTERFRRYRARVEEWIGKPVRAIDCERGLDKDESGEYRQASTDAAYRFGFVVANPRLNYLDDSPLELRRVRVAKEWSAEDLLATLAARMPRRGRYADAFEGNAPRADWIADRADLSVANGSLRIATQQGGAGGIVFLGGTDRWSDGGVSVSVAGKPDGQFWISLRGTAVRLGVSHGRVVIQKSEDGETHEYGSRELPGRQFVLGLRVTGGRATATVDGEPIGDRPVEMPATPARGPLSLAVWDSDGKASVVLKRVEAAPLHVRCAIVGAVPGEGVWDELRRQVDDLAVLSPRYFAWRDGHAIESGAGDAALSIFASHHRLRFLPIVDVEPREQNPDFAGLGTQLLRWARQPGFGGLNLQVHSKLASNERWQALVEDLRNQLRGEGRSIAVTVADQKGELPGALREFGNIYSIEGTAGGPLEIAVAPTSLVGAPAG